MIRSFLISMALVGVSQAAPDKAPASLSWENFDKVSEYVRLKEGDLNYQKVTWLSTVIDGQREAQKQDKPLLLWLYFGDPRANC